MDGGRILRGAGMRVKGAARGCKAGAIASITQLIADIGLIY